MTLGDSAKIIFVISHINTCKHILFFAFVCVVMFSNDESLGANTEVEGDRKKEREMVREVDFCRILSTSCLCDLVLMFM